MWGLQVTDIGPKWNLLSTFCSLHSSEFHAYVEWFWNKNVQAESNFLLCSRFSIVCKEHAEVKYNC
jgi:hypothetical protein